MKYQGSKARIFGEFRHLVLANRRGAPYVEPFLGGANSMCLVGGPRVGADWRGIS